MIGYRFKFRRMVVFAAVLGIAIFALKASALGADSSAATRAARLTYLQGTVTITEAQNTAPIPAQLNVPILSGVHLGTGDDGQAEVEFEDGSVIRLTPNSALSFDNLTVEPGGVFTTGLTLLHGLAYAELRATPQYHYTLVAGGDVLSPVENVTVRVNFDQPPATFSVLDGTAHVERQSTPDSGSSYQTDVRAGETLREDSADSSRYFLTQGVDADSWDQWNEDLDQSAAAQAASTTDVRNNYAGAQGYGWSDLDANGSWYDVPGQGQVWQPQVAVDDSGFDPYGNGAWVAYPGTGYIWASSYPWGWTPYRCGSWSYFNSFGWGWSPGTGCGGFGWGFVGGGRPVNIGLAPAGYRPIRVPVPGHGPERPWLSVHRENTSQSVAQSRPVERGPRQIGGMIVRPIEPSHNDFNSDGVTVGSSLRRDFPVDSKTRTPVLGLASTRPAALNPVSVWPANGDRPARSQAPVTSMRPALVSPSNNGGYSAPAVRSAPGSPQYQRPAPQNVPTQRNVPSPPQSTPRPTYSNPSSTQTERRTYAPPPQVARPTYSPPPPASHPSYAPPPAAPSAPSRSPK
jgi:hypothetical protein